MAGNQLDTSGLRKLISQARLDKAFDLLSRSEFNPSEDFTALSGRYNTYWTSRKQRKQNESNEELEIIINNISSDLLHYIGEIDEQLRLKDPKYLQQQLDEYLKKRVHFSAPNSGNTRGLKNTKNTFIKPRFYIGNEKKRHFTDLEAFLDKWLDKDTSMRNIVVLAEGGMGKSTFLNYYLSRLSKRILASDEGALDYYYPIFCPLVNIYNNSEGNIKDFLLKTLIPSISINPLSFKKLLKEGKLLFILDSFDEMGYVPNQRQRVKVFNEIKSIIEDYPGNKILLAGRGSFFRDKEERHAALKTVGIAKDTWPFFQEIYLLPLSPEDILLYMEKFFETKELATENFKWVTHKKRKRLADLAGHPFFLFLICSGIENAKNNYNEEENHAEFFLLDYYVKGWIAREETRATLDVLVSDKTKGMNAFESLKIGDLVHAFFTAVALEFYQRGKMKNEDLKNKITAVKLSWADLKIIFDEGLETINIQIPSDIEKDQILSELITGYFLKWSDHAYVFLHDFFLYYFLSNKIKNIVIEKNVSHPLYRNIEWNSGVVDLAAPLIKNLKELQSLPQPVLLSLSRGKRRSMVRSYLFRKIGIFLMFFSRLIVPTLANSVLILGLMLIAVLLSSTVSSAITWGIISILYLSYSFLLLTKKQRFWNYLFRILAKEKRTDFSLLVKAYQIAFKNGHFNKVDDQDLFIRLLCTYTIFPEVSDMEFPRTSFFKHNLIDITFKNFTLNDGYFFVGHAYDCIFENARFPKSSFYLVSFIGCQFRNVDFSNMSFSTSWFKQLSIIRKSLHFLGFTKGSPNPNMYLMEFTEMSEIDMDQDSINSLKEYIQKHDLEVGKHIYCPEWLITALKV